MESTAFDRLAKVIGQPASRRAGLQAAIVSLLAFGESSAVTKDRGNGTSHRDRARAEACIPTGKSCPGMKPRGHNKHGKARTLSCNKCCQKHTAVVNGVTTCACQPDGSPCAATTECCLGACSGGSCRPPCTGPALGQICDLNGTPCCTDVNSDAECAGGFNDQDSTCQDCTSPPTAAGALCQTPLGNQCCGGDRFCFVGVRVQDNQPTCLSGGKCVVEGNCTGDGPAGGCPDPASPICFRNDSTLPFSAGCCNNGNATICGRPCPVGLAEASKDRVPGAILPGSRTK